MSTLQVPLISVIHGDDDDGGDPYGGREDADGLRVDAAPPGLRVDAAGPTPHSGTSIVSMYRFDGAAREGALASLNGEDDGAWAEQRGHLIVHVRK